MENNLKGKQSTLFAEDFPASLSVLPGSEEAKKMTVTSGLNISGLYKKSDPVGLLAKMLLASSIWASTKCFLTWKVKTTPAKRLLFQLVPSTPRTEEIESGFWQTPSAGDGGTPRTQKYIDGGFQIHLSTQVATPTLWPTPRASEWKGVGPIGSKSHQHRLAKGYLDAGVQEVNGATGQLNPNWVEWLMGFPPGWTDISTESRTSQE